MFFLIFVIFAYSLVQSLFGIGLLVLGTPTLLLADYPFYDALNILLPSSLFVSLLQIIDSRSLYTKKSLSSLLSVLPTLVVALLIASYFETKLDIKFLVGMFTLLVVVIRFSRRIQETTRAFLSHHQSILIPVIGFVHGLSNMGGALLTTHCAFSYPNKKAARAHVSLGYFLMVTCQIVVLSLSNHMLLSNKIWLFPMISSLSYLIVGRQSFAMASENIYQHSLTVLLLIIGLMLVF